MGLPSLRGLTIDVLGQAETVGQGVAAAVREISPKLVEDLVDGLERVPGLVVQAAAAIGAGGDLIARAGRLLDDIEDPVRRLLPLGRALADAVDDGVAEAVLDVVRRWPHLLDQMTDDVVPALTAMQGAVPEVLSLRELAERLEPLVTELSNTMSGLPGARRAHDRGARERAVESAGEQ